MTLPHSYQTLSPSSLLTHWDSHRPCHPRPTPPQKCLQHGYGQLTREGLRHTIPPDPRVKCIILTGPDPTDKTVSSAPAWTSQPYHNPRPKTKQVYSSPPLLSVEAAAGNLPAPPSPSSRTPRAPSRGTRTATGGGRVSLTIYRCRMPVMAAISETAVGDRLLAMGCLRRWWWRDGVTEGAGAGGGWGGGALFFLGGGGGKVSVVTMREIFYRDPAIPAGAHLLESRVLLDIV